MLATHIHAHHTHSCTSIDIASLQEESNIRLALSHTRSGYHTSISLNDVTAYWVPVSHVLVPTFYTQLS